MLKNLTIINICSLLILINNPTFASKKNHNEITQVKNDIQKEFDETCLDEYADRNTFLKKFIIWAPPTIILSLPVISKAYLIATFGWVILPLEYLEIAIISAALTGPTIIGTAIIFETKHTIEYFGNRMIIQVLDAIRLNDLKNKVVVKFIDKFRAKYPGSKLTNEEISSNLLNLDKSGALCNGDLTKSNSDKMRKLLAKKRHLYKYLSKLR